MAVINNLQAYDAAIRATGCPIDGIDGTGRIYFQVAATAGQIAAANAAAAAYVDTAPQIVAIETILAAMTDPEYQAFMAFAGNHVALHRFIYQARKLDLSLPAVQTLIQALVTNNILTAPRSQIVFAAPAPIPQPPVIAAPIPLL